MKKRLAVILTGIFLLANSVPAFATTGEYEFWLYPYGSYGSTDVETKDDDEQRAYVTGSCVNIPTTEVWYRVKKAAGGSATRAVPKTADSGTFTIPYTYSASAGDRLFLNVQNNRTSGNIIVCGRWTP